MWIAIILAVFFCVLWIVERRKNREVKNLNVARENADACVLKKEQETASMQAELQRQRAALEDMERTLERKKLEARAYCDEKTRNADLYFKKRNAEADALVGKARKDAQVYYEQKVSEADRYMQEKAEETEQLAAQKMQAAQTYYEQKVSETDQYAQEKADETEHLAVQKAQAYFEKKIARISLCIQLRAVEVEQLLKKKKQEANAYYERKVNEAEHYYKAKVSGADVYAHQKNTEVYTYYREMVKAANTYYKEKTEMTDQQVKDAEARLSEMQETLHALQAEVDLLSEKTLVELTSIEPYAALSSHEIKNKLALLKTEEDELVKSGEALLITTNGFIQKRILDSRKKQILRCFHAESSMHIGSITAKNVDTIRARLQRSFQTINTLFSANGVQISQGMLALKLEELSLVYAYMLKIEDEKEKKKIIQAQLREEERVRREMEEEKKKIEKEIRQFSAEVKKLMDYMQKASSDAEKQLYIEKIKELKEKLKALNADKEHVLEREQNTRAGFVYIISNIGSFGENIYKIGMTRRLEPMDRISELSSASVPFPFDVHAMIFSEDAPALETLLHRHFADRQVNKVNARKEFFKVDLEEIKQLVLTHHNATVHFVDVPEAAEYRETLQLEAAQSPA